ncbi:hypothetical protein NDU88_005931 [Pleurodeles waltl]|uniref:Uncharacterized protein n=1 Tax=Pleurodeles waltl TaxID=8319 RepID=A0AAV7ULJ3_PLEWA|nr:hypothetical protein NDU88_005931 [Pleurodeles waltl]
MWELNLWTAVCRCPPVAEDRRCPEDPDIGERVLIFSRAPYGIVLFLSWTRCATVCNVGPGGGRPTPLPIWSLRGLLLRCRAASRACTCTFTGGDFSQRGRGGLEPPARPGAMPPLAPNLSPGTISGLLRCESVGKPRPHLAPTAPRLPQGASRRVLTRPGGLAPLSSGGAAACQHAPLGSLPLRSMYLSPRRLYL